jgi:PAS domain S-box-containing protein
MGIEESCSEGTAKGLWPHMKEFIHISREAILRKWLSKASAAEHAEHLPEAVLRDHIPQLLDRVADQLAMQGRGASLSDLPREHAESRLDLGFNLRSVASEIALLRRVILDCWASAAPTRSRVALEEVVCLDGVLDEVLANSISAYTAARERTLLALDRISNEHMQDDLDEFLRRLLRVILETAGAADTAKIFLVTGEDVVFMAAAGREASSPDRRGMRVGTGFAGRVAAEARPLLLHSAWNDPSVEDPGISSRGIKALYGVPLVHDGRVIGVAEMGSATAYDYSVDEQQLFRAMVGKATAAIVQATTVQREHEAQRKTLQAVARLRTMVTGAPIGFAFLDTSLRYQLVSQWLASMHGHPVEEHPGKMLREMNPHLADRLEPILQRVLGTREPAVNMEETVTIGGAPRTWLVSLYPVITDNGELIGVGKIVTDITERKEAEDLQRRTGEFRELFLSIVAHDLRNPLTAIKILSGRIARERDVPESCLNAAKRIGESANRISEMTASLMDFARGRLGGSIPLERKPCDLADILANAVEEVRTAYPQSTIQLGQTRPAPGEWDRDRLTQVFINLLVNAVCYGSGTPITVTMSVSADSVSVDVHNGGAPIPPEFLPRLFDAFRDSARARGEKSEGLGLGLYIVQQIVRAHGGSVSATSTARDGTTFRVRVPRTVSATAP